jgi:hypothetical protein
MRCTRYNIMWQFVSDLRQVGGFLLVLWFPPGTLVSSWYSGFLLALWFPPGTLVSSPPWYNWNIVESDVKHHKFNHQHDTLILADIYPKIFFLNFMRSSSFFSSPGLWARWAIVITFRLSSIVRPSTFHILIFSSENTGPIATKLWWNGPWMAPFKIVSGDPDFQPRWPPSSK